MNNNIARRITLVDYLDGLTLPQRNELLLHSVELLCNIHGSLRDVDPQITEESELVIDLIVSSISDLLPSHLNAS